jgi:hypothetical protein
VRERRLPTRRRVAGALALIGCFAAGLFAVGALGQETAAGATPSLIVIDQSIGGVAIGSTEAQVKQLYGQPDQSMDVAAGNGAGVLLTYRFKGAFLLVTLVDGRVVTVETTAPYHHTDAAHGSWGPGRLFSSVRLPGARTDQCSGGVWDGSGTKRVATVVTRAGDRIASVWITVIAFYDLCDSQTQEPQFPTTTETTAPAGLFPLNVDAEPSGTGDVTSDPYGIGCPTECGKYYDTGTTVKLKAAPSEGFAFDHWAGDCSGTSPTCTLTMDGPHSAIAIFSGNGPPYVPPADTGPPEGPGKHATTATTATTTTQTTDGTD